MKQDISKPCKTKFIWEVRYPTWLANPLLVKKDNGQWRMCADYTDLNNASPKDPYPLPSVNQFVEKALEFGLLRFMDAYSRNNQICMSPEDEEKTALMSHTSNFCYKVMSFSFKNAGGTY